MEFPFLFIATHGNPCPSCSLQLGSCALHNLKGHRSHLFSGRGAPGIGHCGGSVSCHLHSHFMPLLWKERGVGVSGVIVSFFFFFFLFCQRFTSVSELWLLPPKLSLQLQCTDGLRGCVYMCVRTCVCILGRGVYF